MYIPGLTEIATAAYAIPRHQNTTPAKESAQVDVVLRDVGRKGCPSVRTPRGSRDKEVHGLKRQHSRRQLDSLRVTVSSPHQRYDSCHKCRVGR